MVSLPTHGERMKLAIIDAGLALWKENRQPVSARKVGQHMNMTHSAILYHFESAQGLTDALAAAAVERSDAVIVPMLIAMKHPATAAMSPDQRQAFLAGF